MVIKGEGEYLTVGRRIVAQIDKGGDSGAGVGRGGATYLAGSRLLADVDRIAEIDIKVARRVVRADNRLGLEGRAVEHLVAGIDLAGVGRCSV